jgi:hypothetical protein
MPRYRLGPIGLDDIRFIFRSPLHFLRHGFDGFAGHRACLGGTSPAQQDLPNKFLDGVARDQLEAKMLGAGIATDGASTANPADHLIKMAEKHSKNFEHHVPSVADER